MGSSSCISSHIQAVALLPLCLMRPHGPHKLADSKWPADEHTTYRHRWEEQGFFRPDKSASGEPFTMPMPPPNVTGRLHMGHAMFVTLQASPPVAIGTRLVTDCYVAKVYMSLGPSERCRHMPSLMQYRTSWHGLPACGGAPPCGCQAPTTQALPHR